MVARHYDVNANQVFSWRKLYGDDLRATAVSSVPQLVPVMVTAEQDAVATQPPPVAETIEIDVAGKYRVRHTPQCLRIDTAADGSTCWSGDDSGSLWCAGLGSDERICGAA